MQDLTPANFFELKGYSHRELFDGCQYVWEALGRMSAYFEQFPLGKIDGEVSSAAFLLHPEQISIGPGTTVEPGAYIKGPCIIGRDCSIRRGAYIRGGVITGDSCVIGHATEIKGSILLDCAYAAHFNYVGDSIMGNGTNLGAGAKAANLRFDDREIHVEGIDTGLRKLGMILGDDAQLGCNVVANPGTLLGRGARVAPCLNVGGLIRQDSLVKK